MKKKKENNTKFVVISQEFCKFKNSVALKTKIAILKILLNNKKSIIEVKTIALILKFIKINYEKN